MSQYDWAMLALVLGVAIFSSWRGLLWQLANLGSFVVGGMMVYLYLDTAAPLTGLARPWDRLVAGAALYAIGALFTYVTANVFRRTLRQLGLDGLDRHLGFVWGLCQGVALATVLTLLLVLATPDPNAPVKHSHAAALAIRAAEWARPMIPKSVAERFLEASRAIRWAAAHRHRPPDGRPLWLLLKGGVP